MTVSSLVPVLIVLAVLTLLFLGIHWLFIRYWGDKPQRRLFKQHQ